MTVAESANTEARMLGKSVQVGQLAMLTTIAQLPITPTAASKAATIAGRSQTVLGSRGVKG